MLIYNNIVVGSGPSGCLVFKKLKKKSLIITGETHKEIKTNNIHPKIRVKLNKNTNKFADLVYSQKNNFSIYSSSEFGGLTNYWGKQFFDYKENEYWPNKIFKKFSIYKKNLELIDKKYLSIKSRIIKKTSINELSINQLIPPIFKATTLNKFKLNKEIKNQLIEDLVLSFKKIKKNLIKVITEKKVFYCKNLILCAGPIGNAMILLRSFQNIKYLQFKDDNPRLIFGLITGKKKYHLSNDDKLMDFDIIKNNKSLIYSTIYKVDPNHFNVYLKPFIMLFKGILAKFFFYGLFWTSNEYNKISLTNNKDGISLSAKRIKARPSKINKIKILDKIGLKVLKIISLKFAYGFHYHSLRIGYKNELLLFDKFIDKMNLSNEVFCFDSSVIEKISLKPPTKTYLATSNYLVEKFLKKKKL